VKRCAIAFETIADYQEGRLTDSAAMLVRQHLDRDCMTCHQNLTWLQHTADTLRQSHKVQVPESALTYAGNLFRERFRPVEVSSQASTNTLISWLASLQFDSRNSMPAMAGARGAKREGVQLVYSTDMHDIDIFQELTAEGAWYLIGQVMPREGAAIIVPAEIVLTERNGSRLAFTPDSEEFHLPSIPQGIYEIELSLTDGKITLPNVGVGQ